MERDDSGSQGPEVDLSELIGRTYRCIDGCALCCLCQPELLQEEERAFRNDPELAAGVTDSHISSEVEGAAIKLRGKHGACHFLRDDRRCEIYDRRSHYCRTFPLNVFVGWRIQVNANLSCRGIGLPGEDLEGLARCLLDEHGTDRLTEEVASAGDVFTQFVRNSRDAGVAQSFSSVREAAEKLQDELTDSIGLSRVMTFAEGANLRQNSGAPDIVRRVRQTEAEADIYERALMDGVELFDLPDLSLLPVYIDQELRWRMFRLVGREIVGYDLREDGRTTEISRTDPNSVDLVPMNEGGRASMREYLKVINARDCFLGHGAYLCDLEGYEFNFAQAYLGAAANNMIDLWWRASLLATHAGKDEIGPPEVREGVVFFDMDLLDLPTIGAFI
ncbi:TPA: YkgJ family cysteine cluster protein [Thermoplasmata archaeon]|nr:YkgJ family cysteine cluster protein [Thermoplasmata archaeon]